jgi:hypothetical protein
MKKALLFIAVIVFSSLLITSCSTPADNWSCSKLKSEIKDCEKNIYASKYHYENGTMTYERYKENVKLLEDAIKHYRVKLKTCKDKPFKHTSQTTYTTSSGNTTNQVEKKEELKLTNSVGQIEGTWSSSEGREYGFVKTTFKKIGENELKAVSVLIDGSTYVEYLRINTAGEYHNDKKFGEYYKIVGNSLGSYDKQGLIYLLNKD